jgi:hypothetical protein
MISKAKTNPSDTNTASETTLSADIMRLPFFPNNHRTTTPKKTVTTQQREDRISTTMPEQRPVDKKFDLRSYYPTIRHFACLHEAGMIDHRDSIDTHVALLINNDHTKVNEEEFTALIHPRWCPACVERRTTLLEQGLVRRLANIDLFIDDEAVRRNEKVYVQGVFNGRVHALTTRLQENEQQFQFVSTNLERGMNEVAAMTSETPIRSLDEEPARVPRMPNGINLSENDEQLAAVLDTRGMQGLIDKMFNSRLNEGHDLLAALLGRLATGDNEVERDELHMVLEIELELAQIADRQEKQGFENGRDLQARLEKIALSKETVGEREELLEQALL